MPMLAALIGGIFAIGAAMSLFGIVGNPQARIADLLGVAALLCYLGAILAWDIVRAAKKDRHTPKIPPHHVSAYDRPATWRGKDRP